MRKYLFPILLAALTISANAEKYTIVFNSGNADSSSPTSELNSIVYSATGNCVEEILTANKIYRAKDGYGIKGGTASVGAKLTLGLDDTYNISSLTVYASAYDTKDDTTSTKTYTRGIVICGQYFDWQAGYRTKLYPYTVSLNKATDSITIASNVDNKNRWYVQKIEFEAEDPHPSKAAVELPYAKVDFGSVHWESEDEPLEDVLNIAITGRNVVGNINLSLKKGTSFTLTETTLPAVGGELDIFYSLICSEVTSAFPVEDVLIAKATGLDGIERTRELPIVLTVTPQSSGASAFVLDTACMAIGAMPGDYYAYAQNTADS